MFKTNFDILSRQFDLAVKRNNFKKEKHECFGYIYTLNTRILFLQLSRRGYIFITKVHTL